MLCSLASFPASDHTSILVHKKVSISNCKKFQKWRCEGKHGKYIGSSLGWRWGWVVRRRFKAVYFYRCLIECWITLLWPSRSNLWRTWQNFHAVIRFSCNGCKKYWTLFKPLNYFVWQNYLPSRNSPKSVSSIRVVSSNNASS